MGNQAYSQLLASQDTEHGFPRVAKGRSESALTEGVCRLPGILHTLSCGSEASVGGVPDQGS